MPMSRWVWTASFALVLAGRPTDALSQAVATLIVVTPAGVNRRAGAAAGVYEIVLPFVQVGLTDRISFGA